MNRTQNEPIRDNVSRDEPISALFWMVFTAAALLFVWNLWSDPMISRNEARRLIVIREMLSNHQWLAPTKNGMLYLDKPPLFYWVGALTRAICGNTADWVARLPSALAALFTTVFLYRRIRDNIGLRPALFSALVLVSSPFYIMHARRAEINIFFGMLCFSALLLHFDFLQTGRKRYLFSSFGLLGLAVLTKGPVALVFFLPPLLVYALVRRNCGMVRGLLNPFGWLLFAVVSAPWFLYALYGIPDSPLMNVFQRDIIGKTYQDAASDPFYAYFVFLLGAFAPWYLVLFYKPKRWLKRMVSAERQFLLCAFGTPLIIMSLVTTKHGKYLIPLFPFLAAFLGCVVSDVFGELGRFRGSRFQTVFIRLSGVFLLVLFVTMVLGPPRIYAVKYITLKPFAEKIRSLHAGTKVFSSFEEQVQLIYYYGAPIPVLEENQIDAKLKRGESFLLVAEADHRALLEGKNLCLIEQFSPYLKKGQAGLLYGSGQFCQNPPQADTPP